MRTNHFIVAIQTSKIYNFKKLQNKFIKNENRN